VSIFQTLFENIFRTLIEMHGHRSFFLVPFLLVPLILAACAPLASPPYPTDPSANAGQNLVLITANPNASPTPSPFQPLPASDTPVPSPTLTPTDTQVPSATPTATSLPPTPTFTTVPSTESATTIPEAARTSYALYVSLNYSGKTAAVDETIRYMNSTGQSLADVVLAVEPNLWSNCFSLTVLDQDGAPLANYTLSGQKLTITPAQLLPPGAVTTFSLSYKLVLPPKRFEETFGYLGNQINLTDWYPFIVPYSNGWILHNVWSFGDHLVYDSADFEVNIKVDNPKVVIAASGLAEANGEWTRYRLAGARTFVWSASDQFLLEQSAVGPIVIRSYYFAGNENAGDAVLNMAKQAIALYEVKFAPAPYPSLSVVETDMTDGQEFDGLVFLAIRFYAEYNGSGKSNLVTIGAHEIAHQWWFGLVGDDQALEPWLDEAMAVYAERIFYQYNYPNYGNWWWDFRVNYFGADGYVDSSIYENATFHQYVSAVYLNGARFLEALRTRVGDDVFFAFLKDYASRYGRKHVTATDFFSTLRLHTNTDFSDILQRYFQGSY
jgi:Peptidase family M1 domain